MKSLPLLIEGPTAHSALDVLVDVLGQAGVNCEIECSAVEGHVHLIFDDAAIGYKRYSVDQYRGLTPLQMLAQFHNKFGLRYDDAPRMLTTAEYEFRKVCHAEEAEEYADAKTLEDQADALADLVYFAYGTAHRQGINLDEVLLRVHAANMAKEVNPGKQRRGFELEITKPADWKPPFLGDLVNPNAPLISDTAIKELVTVQAEPPRLVYEDLRGLICIDGPDATGKSTLAKRIAEITEGEVIHLTWTPELEQCMDQYRHGAIDYAIALAKTKVVVLERPWLSHPVYAEVYREGQYNLQNVLDWKADTENNQKCAIMALPQDRTAWMENYYQMCKKRHELHGDNLEAMGKVYNMFSEHIMYASTDLSPRGDGSLFMYDYLCCTSQHDLDEYIIDNIIPKLEVK